MTMALDDLFHIEAIKQLKARYCRLIDSRAWEALLEQFIPEATFDGFKIVPAGVNAEAFVSKLREALEGSVTVHHCHTPEIRLLGPQEAAGIWAMEDIVQWPALRPVPVYSSAKGFKGYGFYEERYRLRDGTWRFSFMRLTRTRIDPIEPDPSKPPFDLFASLGNLTKPDLTWLSKGLA